MTDKLNKVPNVAPTTTDKIISERLELEEEAPSAPLVETPDGTKLVNRTGGKVTYDLVTINDLAAASGIISDPYSMKLEPDNRHITEKIYMNSEEFNQLRKVLFEEHREVFELIGGYMVHDPFTFVMRMNTWLGMSVQFDSWNEAGICKQFLDVLIAKRKPIVITSH